MNKLIKISSKKISCPSKRHGLERKNYPIDYYYTSYGLHSLILYLKEDLDFICKIFGNISEPTKTGEELKIIALGTDFHLERENAVEEIFCVVFISRRNYDKTLPFKYRWCIRMAYPFTEEDSECKK